MVKPRLPRALDGVAVAKGEDSVAGARRRIMVPPASPLGAPPARGDSGEGAWAASWAKRLGGRAESAHYLASVAAWRNAWRPAQVRVLLVAESHVAEAPGDVEVSVDPPKWAYRHLPTSFCRLVYCLGYGEPELCTPRPVNNDKGTIDFWDIFGAIAGGSQNAQPRKGSSTPLEHRLQWKLDVLTWLKQHGVWLVDACAAGVCISGGIRAVDGRAYGEMVRDSFSRFVWPSVFKEPKQQVWVIGAGVKKALAPIDPALARLGFHITGAINQPGDHDRDRYLSGLGKMVSSLRALVPERP